MAKFDDQLSRMSYLMEYRMPSNEVKSNIEYHANGADGKVYGILKEGTHYYIKTTESGKENIAESYDYIGGFNNRKENEYGSYNEATKQLEMKLISLNEAHGIHEDVSTVDFDRSKKVLSMLTEEARTELDRMKQIFENSNTIGAPVVGKDSVHGTATDPKAEGAPFGEGSSEGTHEKGTTKTESNPEKANDDYTTVKNVEKQMTSDKTPSGGTEKKGETAKCDLEGKCVATVKEGVEECGLNSQNVDANVVSEDEIPSEENYFEKEDAEGYGPMGHPDGDEIELYNAEEEPVGFDEPGEEMFDEDPNLGNGEPAFEEPDYENMSLDDMLNEYESVIAGDKEELTGPGTSEPDNAIATWNRMPEDKAKDTLEENEESAKPESEEALTGEKKSEGNPEDAIATWPRVPGDKEKKDNVNERIEKAVSREVKRIMESVNKKETLEEMVQRLVNEEVTRLHVWGKHPRFRKEPMTTPANKEKFVGTADRDWNDDSAKGEQPYGLKVGDGKPFEEVVDILTDNVMDKIMEGLSVKKK